MAPGKKSESAVTNAVQVSQRIIGPASRLKRGDNYLHGVNVMSRYVRSVKAGSEEQINDTKERVNEQLRKYFSHRNTGDTLKETEFFKYHLFEVESTIKSFNTSIN